MSKKLITANNIQEHLCGDKFYVGRDMLLSPMAKDYCKEKNITIVYETTGIKNEKDMKTSNVKGDEQENLRHMIETILKNEFKIDDKSMIEAVLKKCEGVNK